MDILKKQINELLKEWQDGNTPGFAISIINNETIPDQYYFGCASLEHSIPIDQDTIFYLCSLSKQFTAVCLAFLIKENKISLNDPLRKFFPELPPRVYDQINIGNLVHMSSGIHEWYDMMEFSGSYSDEYPWRKSLIPLLARQKELSFAPGEKFSYCNTNYSLITLIIEKITSISLAEFATSMIFKPLNMNSTFFCEDNNKVIPHRATGYYQVSGINKIAEKLPPLIGAGGVYSNLKDMTLWLKTIIDQNWQPEILDILFSQEKFNNGKPNQYLMGFQKRYYHNNLIISHGGAVPGFFTHISYLPAQKYGFVWMANHSNFKPDLFTNALLSYLEREFKPVSVSSVNTVPVLKDPANYSGNYIYLDEDRSLTVTVEDHALRIEGFSDIFSQKQDNTFENRSDQSNIIIIEEYHQLMIMRIITEKDDRFLLKADKLPVLNDFNRYCGSYFSSELNITYTFTNCKEKLYIESVQRFSGTDLVPIARDIFLSPTKGYKLRFISNEQSVITSFYLDSFRSSNFIFHRISYS